MKKIIFLALLFFFGFSLLNFVSANNSQLPLLRQGDLKYLGAFRVPKGNYSGISATTSVSFSYGGAALTYNPQRNSLILGTNRTSVKSMIAEISIPEPVNSTNMTNLNTATMVQMPVDITNGLLANLGKDLVYNSPTQMAIEAGVKTFNLPTVPTNLTAGSEGFMAGQPIKISAISDTSNYMTGKVTGFSGTSITANITDVFGNGTFNNWEVRTTGSKVGNGGAWGGFLVWGNKLIGNAWAYYDAAYKGFNSHYTASLNWDAEKTSGFQGFYPVGVNPISVTGPNGGFVGGYMTLIPPEWQSSFGGPALTGLGAVSIISRSSMGPSAWVFNPDDVGVINPAPATMLFGYPGSHPTLGAYVDTPNLFYNRVSQYKGLVFPQNTRSILVFGGHGLGITGQGDTCYGVGTPNLNQVKSQQEVTAWINDNGGANYMCGAIAIKMTVSGLAENPCCYDPVFPANKGPHGAPYVYRVWAYDANDLVHVKNKDIITAENRSINIDPTCSNGSVYEPWCVRPYALWNLNSYNLGPYTTSNPAVMNPSDGTSFNIPFAGPEGVIAGAAYDPMRQRIYVAQDSGDRVGYGMFPLIHVFEVQANSSPVNLPIKYHFSDLLSLIMNWLKTISSSADLNSDGKVDARDLGVMMSKWE